MNLLNLLPNLSSFINSKVVTGSSYTVLATDFKKIIYFSAAPTLTITVPDNLPYNFNCCFVIKDEKEITIETTLTLIPGQTVINIENTVLSFQKLNDKLFYTYSVEGRNIGSVVSQLTLNTTDDLPEGTTNLYYDSIKADNDIYPKIDELLAVLNEIETNFFNGNYINNTLVPNINNISNYVRVLTRNVFGVPVVTSADPKVTFKSLVSLTIPISVEILDLSDTSIATVSATSLGNYLYELNLSSLPSGITPSTVYKADISTDNYFYFIYFLSPVISGGAGAGTPANNVPYTLSITVLTTTLANGGIATITGEYTSNVSAGNILSVNFNNQLLNLIVTTPSTPTTIGEWSASVDLTTLPTGTYNSTASISNGSTRAQGSKQIVVTGGSGTPSDPSIKILDISGTGYPKTVSGEYTSSVPGATIEAKDPNNPSTTYPVTIDLPASGSTPGEWSCTVPSPTYMIYVAVTSSQGTGSDRGFLPQT